MISKIMSVFKETKHVFVQLFTGLRNILLWADPVFPVQNGLQLEIHLVPAICAFEKAERK